MVSAEKLENAFFFSLRSVANWILPKRRSVKKATYLVRTHLRKCFGTLEAVNFILDHRHLHPETSLFSHERKDRS